MREEHIQPPTYPWESVKGIVMEAQIRMLCQNIAIHGATTLEQELYDRIFELIEEEVREAYEKGKL